MDQQWTHLSFDHFQWRVHTFFCYRQSKHSTKEGPTRSLLTKWRRWEPGRSRRWKRTQRKPRLTSQSGWSSFYVSSSLEVVSLKFWEFSFSINAVQTTHVSRWSTWYSRVICNYKYSSFCTWEVWAWGGFIGSLRLETRNLRPLQLCTILVTWNSHTARAVRFQRSFLLSSK